MIMKTIYAIVAALALVAGSAEAVTSSIEDNLSEWMDDHNYEIGLRIDNHTDKFIEDAFFECLGFADGEPIARGVGMANQIEPGGHVFTHAIVDTKGKMKSVSCRTTYVYPRRQ
jgi:5-methylthioribose kinase